LFKFQTNSSNYQTWLCFYSCIFIVKLILFMFNVKAKVVGYYENFYCCWLQVSNNPATIRQKSSLIIHHSSLSQHMLPPKYKPTSDIPKVRSWILCETCLVVCGMLWLMDQKSKINRDHMQRLQVRVSFWWYNTAQSPYFPLIQVKHWKI